MAQPKDLYFSPGTLIDGYSITRLVGEGSMGIVFEAEQVRLGRRVCLKFIQPGRLESAHVRKLFETEARSLAEMRHPNIVVIYDVGDYEGAPYLVMEFVDGDDLLQFLSQQQPSPEEVSLIVEGIGAAIAHMHQKGVIHRDLKPSNILIDPSIGPKVCDFGVSKRLGTGRGTTDTGGIGSAGYMAPEVLSGRKYDLRADIYSLAVLSFLLLTRRMPEQGQKPSEFAPGLSAATDAVIAKGLQPNPADRYDTVGAFVKDFVDSLQAAEPKESAPTASGIPPAPQPRQPAAVEPGEMPATAPKPASFMELITPIPSVRGSAPPAEDLIPLAVQKTTNGSKKRKPERSGTGLAGIILVALGVLLFAFAIYILRQPKNSGPAGIVGVPKTTPAATQIIASPAATLSATAASTPATAPRPTIAPTPEPPPLPALQGWAIESEFGVPPRRYAFLAAGKGHLYATTFDSKSDGEGLTELHRIELETGAEQLLLSLPSQPQKALSGLAIDERIPAVFASYDSGDYKTAGVYSISPDGTPRTQFARAGRLEIPNRALGVAVDTGTLYVLIDWGRVLTFDATTGAPRGGTIILQQGALLRDIAIARSTLAGYGNGLLVQRALDPGARSQSRSLIPNPAPRSTEGIGADPLTGAFVTRPFGEPQITTVRDTEDLKSPLVGDGFSDHIVDFAVTPDGSQLYASDLLRRTILRFVRTGATPQASTTLWRLYIADDWIAAQRQERPLMAFAHIGTAPASEAFRQTILNNPQILAKLANVPSFLTATVGGFDPDGLPLNTEPLLALYNARGAVVGRYGPNASPAEVMESITLLGE